MKPNSHPRQSGKQRAPYPPASTTALFLSCLCGSERTSLKAKAAVAFLSCHRRRSIFDQCCSSGFGTIVFGGSAFARRQHKCESTDQQQLGAQCPSQFHQTRLTPMASEEFNCLLCLQPTDQLQVKSTRLSGN